jgi:hypothetical protein
MEPAAVAEAEAVDAIPVSIRTEQVAAAAEQAARARPPWEPADSGVAARSECSSFRPAPRWCRIRSSSEPAPTAAQVVTRVPARREEPAARVDLEVEWTAAMVVLEAPVDEAGIPVPVAAVPAESPQACIPRLAARRP